MPIFSGTKADAAYEELRARILDGTLGPGTPLDQRVLAERYEISTTPIREALRRLEAAQLVVVKAHRGPRVSPLSSQELHHLFAVRLELDPLAAELAASNASPGHRAQVRSILERPISSDVDQVARNREFHRSIYQACGNPVLVQILDSLWTRCDRYRFLLVNPDGLDPQQDKEHRAMADALDARDAKALRELVRSHIDHSHTTLARLAREFIEAHPEAGA